MDLVALENGDLGPLLSPGTLRGLEDECVTDVKVPKTWQWRFGREQETLQAQRGYTGPRGLSSTPFHYCHLPLWISELCPKDAAK